MTRRTWQLMAGVALLGLAVGLVGCGSGSGGSNHFGSPTGGVVMFGTDAPICDVESFMATITSAVLVPQGSGQNATLISSAAPVTLDFARLTDFTDILGSNTDVATGTYNQLKVTVTNPQLVVLNTAANPPAAVTVPVTLSTTTFTITISPALVITSKTTSGLTFDFNLGKSIAVNGSGQVTGTVTPQITATPTTPSGTTIGEATELYGVVQAVSTTNLPAGFTGSLTLALADGTGQTLTVLTNSKTTFEGDGVAAFADLTANTFIEVDATVNSSGQIAAQLIDSEETATVTGQKSAFLGKIVQVSRDGSGNATSFTLLVDDEIPSLAGTVPLQSGLTVSLVDTTHYFTNWQNWNPQAFTLGPQTLGVAQKVAVFGAFGPGPTVSLIAHQVFLRPRNVLGTFQVLQATGSDGISGAFTLVPCGSLFGGTAITVLTYPQTTMTGISGLINLTPGPILSNLGVLFYEQSSGRTLNGGSWPASTWVLQARSVHQLPN